MTTASTDLDLAGTIFVAINRALEAEEYSNSEAFRIAALACWRRLQRRN